MNYFMSTACQSFSTTVFWVIVPLPLYMGPACDTNRLQSHWIDEHANLWSSFGAEHECCLAGRGLFISDLLDL